MESAGDNFSQKFGKYGLMNSRMICEKMTPGKNELDEG